MPRTNSPRRPIAVDLFCGAGGMSLGFEQAGFDVALAVDADGYHVAAHERNFPLGKTLCRSVTDLSADEAIAALGNRTDIDLIFGGPPCQGFSNMGLRDACDPRNTLVHQFVRLVEQLRPKAFVMENVPGMLTGPTRAVLAAAVQGFEAAGYRVTLPVQVLNAASFGVPQNRKRLIVLGIRSELGKAIAYPFEACDGSPNRPTVWEAIADLPKVDDFDELFQCDDADFDVPPQSDYARVMRGLQSLPDDFSHPRRWDAGRCSGCLRVRHSEKAIALYSGTLPGEMVPGHKLPRLDPEGLAPTLRAGSDSSHGSYTAPRPIHPFCPRCITVREAARLHGYPDWFGFYPLKWHGYRQVGNSVCPPVAKALGQAVLRALSIIPFKPTEPISLENGFHLPPERPRTKKRIPQVVHFPPVIERLFRERFDANLQELRESTFTFEDVRAAIATTGVALTWVRADTFLSEIARSRNVCRLLEPCLSQGFTIRKYEDGDRIGQFVRTGHPEGIERDSAEATRRRTGRKGVDGVQKTLF